jgi:hyperosmotically inducible protein
VFLKNKENHGFTNSPTHRNESKGGVMTRSRRYVACVVAIVLVLPLVAACGAKTIGGAIDDQAITARVKTALLNDPQVGATKIDIDTSNGVVTMSGVVKSKAEETHAIELARRVNGVRDVKSALQVPGS